MTRFDMVVWLLGSDKALSALGVPSRNSCRFLRGLSDWHKGTLGSISIVGIVMVRDLWVENYLMKYSKNTFGELYLILLRYIDSIHRIYVVDQCSRSWITRGARHLQS
jgi:hypothetical protein